MGKKFVKLIAFILVLVAVLTGIVFFFVNFEWTDRFGFKHNVETSLNYESDPNATRTFAIVEVDKEILDYDDYKLVQTIRPILNAYSDKAYTTLAFGDGTGIYFPCSDIKNRAFYGEIDEKGNITQDLLYYDFKGNVVETSEIRAELTADSKDLWAHYPEDYKNDSSFAAVVDNDAYIAVAGSERMNSSDMAAAVREFYDIYNANVDLSSYDNVYINIGYTKGYVVSGGQITEDASVLEKFSELF